MLEKGLVQIYTGDGKGKTTAAFGLALRAAGCGNKVLIYQFLKPPSLTLGERASLQSTDLSIKVEALDIDWDMSKSLKDEQKIAQAQEAISQALGKIAAAGARRFYDLLILDEIVFCLSKNLARFEDVKNVIDSRDPHVEVVLTGRGATKQLMELADLVTEMRNIEHPFDKGITPRRGIEF